MKNLKKLLPLFAFVLGLGLVFTQSAFKSHNDQPPLFWYEISSTGTLQTQLNEVKVDKDEAMFGSVPLTECQDVSTDYCIIGYDTEQVIDTSAPSPDSEDHVVLFDRP